MALIWIVLYSFIYTVSQKLSSVLGCRYTITLPAMILFWCILLLFLGRRGKLEVYGFCSPQSKKSTEYLLYLPLAAIPAVNLIISLGQTHKSFKPGLFVLEALFMICCCFGEEFFFRGFLPVWLSRRYKLSRISGMVISSFLFAFMHFAGILNGAPVGFTLVQAIFAGTVGFCFAVFLYRWRSIFPGFVMHSLINITSPEVFGGASVNKMIKQELSVQNVIFLILSILCAFYGVWIYKIYSLKNKGEKI